MLTNAHTQRMHADEIKGLLKQQVGANCVDLNSPDYRFTLWAENGPQGFLLEDHAAFEIDIIRKWAERFYSTKTRTAVLDSESDELYLFSCEVSGGVALEEPLAG